MPPRIRRYPVKRNQTALDIAQELGISSQSLLQANPGVKTLKPGVVLNVPGTGIQPLNAPKGDPIPPPPPAPTGQAPKGWVSPPPVYTPPPQPAPVYAPPYAGGYGATPPAPVYAGGGYGATPKINAPRFDQEIAQAPAAGGWFSELPA